MLAPLVLLGHGAGSTRRPLASRLARSRRRHRAPGFDEKTLHANPGKHEDVLPFEVDSSLRFSTRHLS